MKTSHRYIKKAKAKISTGKRIKPVERAAIKRGDTKLYRERKSALKILSLALVTSSAAAQAYAIQSRPRPKEMPLHEWEAQTGIAIADLAINVSMAIASISKE